MIQNQLIENLVLKADSDAPNDLVVIIVEERGMIIDLAHSFRLKD